MWANVAQERDYLQTRAEKLEKDNQELKQSVFELSQLLSLQVGPWKQGI